MPGMHAVFPSFFRQIGRRAGPAIALATALLVAEPLPAWEPPLPFERLAGPAAECASGASSLAACARLLRSGAAEEAALRQQLSQHLPDYMIPSRIILTDHLPKSPNGKVDRQRLAALLPEHAG